jgi:hypothetical protein
MNMEISKKSRWLMFFVLVVLAGLFAFFYHLYHGDVKKLADFSASYEKFDKAISGFPRRVSESSFANMPAVDSWGGKADEALAELRARASARISSLIKNEAALMSIALEISDLAGKELEALKAYRRAVSGKDINADRLAKESADLTDKRQTAYARFRAQAGLKD